jgi:predicted peptidase
LRKIIFASSSYRIDNISSSGLLFIILFNTSDLNVVTTENDNNHQSKKKESTHRIDISPKNNS